MKIGILETGRPPETLQPEWGTDADMVRMMLGQDRDYRVYEVQAGELPTDPGECGAYVITGSLAGVWACIAMRSSVRRPAWWSR